jgi:RNA 2',3'-cyclic 3'-phosphodiesterase
LGQAPRRIQHTERSYRQTLEQIRQMRKEDQAAQEREERRKRVKEICREARERAAAQANAEVEALLASIFPVKSICLWGIRDCRPPYNERTRMRLFTGLDLPASVTENLAALIGRLRPMARIHWSVPENLHITTKFIGELPEGRLPELQAALAGLAPRSAIPVSIRRVSFFPNPRSPRVFWCGIEAPGLEDLAAETDRCASTLGIPREARAFSPHLTLARIKERINLEPLRQAVAGLDEIEFGSFEAGSFFLYRSQLRPSGSVYTKLAEFPLLK